MSEKPPPAGRIGREDGSPGPPAPGGRDVAPPVVQATVPGKAPPADLPTVSPTDPGMQTIAPPQGAPPFPLGAPPEMPPARYELGHEIARGGMGRVVDATDTLLGRVVALKEALGLDADALKRFARETRITARLEHPAIVPVHDAGTMPNGAPYYVMRKISGRPLERLVAESSSLNERLALVPHIVAAANAIAHAHARGIVHRDIKPSNILLGDLGETVVIDWGLAKVIGEADDASATSHRPGDSLAGSENDEAIKTRAGIVFGTPGFMAPEQLRGAPVDERCDVYALGATLYHMLSRRPPHHAKTADEMMKAAAVQPPMPIGELVPGVPPELSTIVDKSLAHDPAERYQDARTLAEDLQRFLTGQLVASHHYSAGERLLRFVRRHRVPVMISIAALIALGIVAAIAVTRVVGERDRADEAADTARAEKRIAEEERGRAEDRLDKLLLTQARSQVATNPTLAIAMLKPLAVRHWREVRSIAEAARTAGVAWSLPASKKTASIEMSRDGLRALVAGDDGVIRLHDLPARKTRILAERPIPSGKIGARFADGERRVVVWSGPQLAILDPAVPGVVEVNVPTAIRDLEIAGRAAYWTDDKGSLWRFELGTQGPVSIPLDERVDRLTASPDGRWIALWGERHLALLDRTKAGPPEAKNVILGATTDLDWSDDGTHFAALVDLSGDGHALVVAVGDEPAIRQRRFVGQRTFVAYSDRRAYTVGPLGISVVPSDSNRVLTGDPVGVREARGNTVVVGSTSTVVVMSAAGIVELKVPAGRVEAVEASARSPFVLASIEHQVIVWNLDDIQPRILGEELPQLARFVGGDRVLASYVEDPARLYDLSRGGSRELPKLSLRDVKSAGDGSAACAIDAAYRAQLIANLGGEPTVEDLGVADLAGFPTPTTLLLGHGERGSIRLRDLTKRNERVLVTRSGRLGELAWNRNPTSTIAAVFDDGTLWRHNLATGTSSTAALQTRPPQVVVGRDGAVLFPQGREVRTWRPGGELASFAVLPRAIVSVGLAGATRAFAFTERDGTFQIDLTAPDPAARTIETAYFDPRKADAAVDADTLVVASPSGIDIIDPQVRYRWTLAQSSPDWTYGKPQISSDGRRVMAQTGDRLLVWSFVVPTGAAATATWLAAMTNATTAPATGVLTWQ